MAEKPTISEYIDSLSFKKTFGMGYNPDEVYEAICNITSMYNEVLAELHQEVARLRRELDDQKSASTSTPAPTVSPSMPTTPHTPMPPRSPFAAPARPLWPPAPTEVAPAPPPKPARSEAPAVELPPPIEVPKTEIGTEKELRRRNRKQLLEVLLDCSKENDQLRDVIQSLQEQNADLRTRLEDKHIKLNRAGTLAEAAVLVNGVVESTQAAAQQYLDNLEELYRRESVVCMQKEENARRYAQDLLDSTQQQCDQMMRRTEASCQAMERETRETCAAMTKQAREEVERYWEDLSARLEAFYSAHQGLRDMMHSMGMDPLGGRYG